MKIKDLVRSWHIEERPVVACDIVESNPRSRHSTMFWGSHVVPSVPVQVQLRATLKDEQIYLRRRPVWVTLLKGAAADEQTHYVCQGCIVHEGFEWILHVLDRVRRAVQPVRVWA